ncbi:MAG TPA: FtsX-like permease family protein [Mycobacteriales bacterium]|jgi:putative ABC transport system permease protein|nr:FtsX-like permease family protein [Mycobacteriales bacterium]
MFRLALKGALARRLRLALTAMSIMIGVGFVSGTLVLTDTLNATFDQIFGNASKGVSVVVRGEQAFQGSGSNGPTDERGLVPDSVLTTVRSVPGVAEAVGDAGGYAQLVYRGKAVVNGGAPNLGTAWVGEGPLSTLHLVKGAPPAAADQVVIDQKSAEKFGIPVGAPVEVVVSGKTFDAHVTGIVRFGTGSSLAGATVTAFTPQTAQRLLIGSRDSWTIVEAAAQPGVSQDQLRQRIATSLQGQPYQVMTERAYVADQSKQVKSGFQFFNVLLLVFAFISVFVAVFIIFNTFTVLVAQRTRELALLRALGASRGQVLRAVVLEAFAVGLFAGVIGLVAGVLIAAGLRALIESFANGLAIVSLQIQPRTIVVGMLVAVIVTVAAAVVPAFRASRVPPVAAMRDDFVLPTASLRRRNRIGAALLAIGVVLLVLGVRSGNALEIGLGAVAMFRAATALSPLLSQPIIGGLGRLLPRIWGTTGRLARENALRNPRRTAATASALMIGIALTTTMSVMAASITTSANAQIDKSVGADFIITAKNFAPLSDTVAKRIAQVPGAAAVTAFRAGSMKVGNAVKPVQGATGNTVAETLRLSVKSGSVSDVGLGKVLVSEATAKSKHLHVGSALPVEFALTHKQILTVSGIFAKNPIAGDYVIGLDTYDANFRNRLDFVVAVKAADGTNLGTLRQGLAAALKSTPNLQLRDQTQFKQDQKRQINQVLVFVLALLVLSLVIAWLGIVNTLALSVFERTREIGLLRAVGMATRQVRRMVRLEAVVISVFGALLGVVLGLGYGAALVQALASQGIDTTTIPWGQLIGYLVIGAVAGVTAAWWPARRASKLDVLRAIASE